MAIETYPLVNVYITMEKPFSIAMLVYQRVAIEV